MMSKIKLAGRVFIRCEIEAVTGLHIGGTGGSLEIGGIDNPVIRDPITLEPLIPGSSLRGKMRSQLEKKLGSLQNQKVGKASIHVCKGEDAKNPCPVCRLFGLPATEGIGTPAILLVRDVRLTSDSIKMLNNAHTDQMFTETKAEVAIDRVTAAASPRSIERVPAGSVFGPAEMVLSFYRSEDLSSLSDLLDCMQLAEDDYLGGGGSRGSGKIHFRELTLSLRTAEDYSMETKLGKYADLKQFKDEYPQLLASIKKDLIFAEE